MLTEEEFKDHLDQFVETSNRLRDGWFIDKIRNQPFMRKQNVSTPYKNDATPRRSYSPTATTSDQQRQADVGLGLPKDLSSATRFSPVQSTVLVLEDEDDEISEVDSNCLTPSNASSHTVTYRYEYHVVYSESYAVPVLYLNVLDSSGKRIGLDHVWDLCPETFQPYLHENKWTTLTQQEHPLLGIPFLMLHPCHTADLMAQITKGSTAEGKCKRNYLVTWLSAVGPFVGLNISEQYAVPLKVCK